ncbi:ABC transporter, putative [Leishmania panamensis]|uniref:ABC transporter, putative n=1 Tax=Leishmania panamensis TaxID=5679 RepID=A0AC62A504_LEIPA
MWGAFGTVVRIYEFTTPDALGELPVTHSRIACVVLDACLKNEGLYSKVGQGLNSMGHVLPREYTDVLNVLLGRAPPVAIAEIRKTICAETGREIEELLACFDEAPVASAPIAQGHQAWLPPPADGSSPEPQRVAVKVRKPCISTQSVWGLCMHSAIMMPLNVLFDLPTDWSRKTVCDALARVIGGKGARRPRPISSNARGCRRHDGRAPDHTTGPATPQGEEPPRRATVCRGGGRRGVAACAHVSGLVRG